MLTHILSRLIVRNLAKLNAYTQPYELYSFIGLSPNSYKSNATIFNIKHVTNNSIYFKNFFLFFRVDSWPSDPPIGEHGHLHSLCDVAVFLVCPQCVNFYNQLLHQLLQTTSTTNFYNQLLQPTSTTNFFVGCFV